MKPKSTELGHDYSQAIPAIFQKQQEHALRLRRSTLDERLEKLQKLKNAVLLNQEEMCKAAWADFKKTPAEVEFAEIFAVLSQVNHAGDDLHRYQSGAG